MKSKAKARQSYVLKEPLWWKIDLCSFSFISYHDYDVAGFFFVPECIISRLHVFRVLSLRLWYCVTSGVNINVLHLILKINVALFAERLVSTSRLHSVRTRQNAMLLLFEPFGSVAIFRIQITCYTTLIL